MNNESKQQEANWLNPVILMNEPTQMSLSLWWGNGRNNQTITRNKRLHLIQLLPGQILPGRIMKHNLLCSNEIHDTNHLYDLSAYLVLSNQ